MLRTIFKALLIIIIVAAICWGLGSLLVLTNFGIAVGIGNLLVKAAPFVGIISGLWWWVNDGWGWTRGRSPS